MAVFYNQATLSYNDITVSSNIVTGTIIDTLSVSKTAVSDAYSPGETLTYTVSLVNSGTSALTGLTLTDDLGAYEFNGQTLVPLTYEDGSVNLFVNGVLQPAPTVTAADSLEISGIGIPAGGNAVVIYQAAANGFAPAEAGSVITNTVTAAGQGVSAVTASAEVPAESEAVLSISKSLSPDEVSGNARITYTFVIQNTGNTAAGSPVIRDTFDPALSDIAVTIDGVIQQADDYTYDEQTGVFETTAGAFTAPAATFTRDPATGAVTVVPGTVTVTVEGNI